QRLDSVGPKMGACRRTTLNRGSEVGEASGGVSRHDRPARGVGAGRSRPYASVTDRTLVARWRLARHLRIPQIYTGAAVAYVAKYEANVAGPKSRPPYGVDPNRRRLPVGRPSGGGGESVGAPGDAPCSPFGGQWRT